MAAFSRSVNHAKKAIEQKFKSILTPPLSPVTTQLLYWRFGRYGGGKKY
jgi:hypothetical protein